MGKRTTLYLVLALGAAGMAIDVARRVGERAAELAREGVSLWLWARAKS